MLKFDEDLAAVHGYLCADGYVIKNPKTQNHKYYVIGFRNQNEVLLKDFQDRFRKVFHKNPSIRKDGRCVVNSKPIYEMLSNEWSFYSDSWELPKLSKNNLKLWIRSFFDCEGWVELNGRKNRRIAADSKNQGGLLKVKKSLETFGIKSILKKKPGRNTYRLQIFGKVYIKKYYDEIGFLHPEKMEKLKKVLNSYVDYFWKFPETRAKRGIFVRGLLHEKAKTSKSRIRVFSNKIDNLQQLSSILNINFNIKACINEGRNGQGTTFYELSINRKIDVKKALNHGLLNKEANEILEGLL